MAGDWIKMRGNLWDDPRVARLCDLTESTEASIVGGLYWLWATADQHSEDGVMPGLTLRSIDRKTGISGFGDALCVVGWLADHPEGVRICHFEEHNGASAKSRLMTAKRVAEHKANAKVTVVALPETDDTVTFALPREEKEKEEEKDIKPLLNSKTEASPRGTRLASSWQAPDEFIEFCKTARPDLNPHCLIDKFRDYWSAIPGSKGLKTDWLATWRNFVKSERLPQQARASPSTKFDPLAYVNRNRLKAPDERTITLDANGEPFIEMVQSTSTA